MVQDFAIQGFLIGTNAAALLWPRLLLSYSRSVDPVALPMVMGAFVQEDDEDDEDEEDDE